MATAILLATWRSSNLIKEIAWCARRATTRWVLPVNYSASLEKLEMVNASLNAILLKTALIAGTAWCVLLILP
jgi:hypothetical protein